MSGEATFPVQVLREHTTALEAAISVCLAEPDHKPVHKLRTETRRVEAELLLLSHMAEVPEHRAEGDALLKELKRLRRAAGEVRDLDVHRKILDEYAKHEAADGSAAMNGAGAKGKAGDGAAKKAVAKKAGAKQANRASSNGSGPGTEASRSALEKGASDLRAHMGKQRDARAADLLKLLKKRQTKVASAAEGMLKALQPADAFAMRAVDLLHHARAVVEREGLLARGDVKAMSKRELHTVRKAAKAARYLAETLPENAEAERAAAHYESLQETGGQWHDLLDLAKEARQYLGKGHELTVKLAEERDRKRELYRNALTEEVKTHVPRKKPVKADRSLASGKRNGRRAAA